MRGFWGNSDRYARCGLTHASGGDAGQSESDAGHGEMDPDETILPVVEGRYMSYHAEGQSICERLSIGTLVNA